MPQTFVLQNDTDPRKSSRSIAVTLLGVLVVLIVAILTRNFARLTVSDQTLLDSTVGELAIWMSAQTEEEEIESYLGQFAEYVAQSRGEETLDETILLDVMRKGLVGWSILLGISAIVGLIALYAKPAWTRNILLGTLLGMDSLLFVIPTIDAVSSLTLILVGITLLLAIHLLIPGTVSRTAGFFVILSLIFVVWEVSKTWAQSIEYNVTVSQENWEYQTYPTLEELLDALDAGEVTAVIFDRRDLSDVMAPYPLDDSDPNGFEYENLRYLDDLNRSDGVWLFQTIPEFPGRLSIAVAQDYLVQYESDHEFRLGDFKDVAIATVLGEFADERYLSQPRSLVLVDLKILNDINLPHLQTIAEAFMQPARRNGSQLLIRILAAAGFYTWGEAGLGFVIGAVLGFVLGVVFAHSAMMERSLLPYVVASQTVPILAIAPMVVIWMGASQISVSVIAAYLTFFPVTINTLRGLQAPKPTEVELMQSYAASRWTILWKLRVPTALPYIFTALKVSATASVVGAIIGELPSGIGDGLGRAILDFSSDYSLISTPKLWASIVMAASVGVVFFVAVSIAERLVLGRYFRNI